MVVKDRRGRRRYIAFVVRSDMRIEEKELIEALRRAAMAAGAKVPSLIQFDQETGIVRCRLEDKDVTIELLNTMGDRERFGIETLRTSGTIKTLRERYFSGSRVP